MSARQRLTDDPTPGGAGCSKYQYLRLGGPGAIVGGIVHGCLLEWRDASQEAVPQFRFGGDSQSLPCASSSRVHFNVDSRPLPSGSGRDLGDEVAIGAQWTAE